MGKRAFRFLAAFFMIIAAAAAVFISGSLRTDSGAGSDYAYSYRIPQLTVSDSIELEAVDQEIQYLSAEIDELERLARPLHEPGHPSGNQFYLNNSGVSEETVARYEQLTARLEVLLSERELLIDSEAAPADEAEVQRLIDDCYIRQEELGSEIFSLNRRRSSYVYRLNYYLAAALLLVSLIVTAFQSFYINGNNKKLRYIVLVGAIITALLSAGDIPLSEEQKFNDRLNEYIIALECLDIQFSTQLALLGAVDDEAEYQQLRDSFVSFQDELSRVRRDYTDVIRRL